MHIFTLFFIYVFLPNPLCMYHLFLNITFIYILIFLININQKNHVGIVYRRYNNTCVFLCIFLKLFTDFLKIFCANLLCFGFIFQIFKQVIYCTNIVYLLKFVSEKFRYYSSLLFRNRISIFFNVHNPRWFSPFLYYS